MNVLFLSPYPPYPPTFGGSVRIHHLMKQVARRHKVWSLSYTSTVDGLEGRDEFEAFVEATVEVPRPPERKRLTQMLSLASSRSFQKMAHYSDAMQRELDSMVYENSIDVVVVEFSQMACFDIPPGPAVLIDEHNVEWNLLQREWEAASPASLRRLYAGQEFRKFRREEMAALARADLVTVTSPRDRELLLEDDQKLDIHVVENGVDIEFFQPVERAPDPDTLVFTGTMHYHPNTQAARWFVEDILPALATEVPGVRFVGAGGQVPDELAALATEQVQFTGYVPDIREWFHRAQVFVVPLLVGGGTRFKVVEAMAAGKPVVSTRLGAEGIGATHGENILFADTPNDFAREVADLLADPERAAELARAGRSFVEQNFAWEVIGERLETALQSALNKREARSL
ncbi:MAG: glycosyl transferase family 1 [Planctomycetota bacterium]|nr:MAG: glycosyl transferase family 1 [Planctomycetota bacterium]